MQKETNTSTIEGFFALLVYIHQAVMESKEKRKFSCRYRTKELFREVISGSGRSAQKSEKLAYFEPISEPQLEEKIGIFFKKCGIFLIRRLQFL